MVEYVNLELNEIYSSDPMYNHCPRNLRSIKIQILCIEITLANHPIIEL